MDSVKFSWTIILLTLICVLVDIPINISLHLLVSNPPVWLLGLSPIVDAKHDGEGAGGQQLLVVVVVQAVSCCQGKSVPNLSRGSMQKQLNLIEMMIFKQNMNE